MDNVIRVAVPATLDYSDAYRFDANTALLLDNLAYWVLSAALIGAALMVSAASVLGRRTGLLPRWLVWAGLLTVLAILVEATPPQASVVALLQKATGMEVGGRAWTGGQADHVEFWMIGLWVVGISVRMLWSDRGHAGRSAS